ncbi:hypothetical protein BJY01DRAFT_255474 [Aspergillus pseudoustus]|uniref:Uncharacterized protein n=1 Tax=Aspergillus pseudoustus TaxID=1810923 RepID=A0ABR4IK51_9EURO
MQLSDSLTPLHTIWERWPDTTLSSLGSISGRQDHSAPISRKRPARAFPKIMVSMMATTGSGLPGIATPKEGGCYPLEGEDKHHDVRLGDVMVSWPIGLYGGICLGWSSYDDSPERALAEVCGGNCCGLW